MIVVMIFMLHYSTVHCPSNMNNQRNLDIFIFFFPLIFPMYQQRRNVSFFLRERNGNKRNKKEIKMNMDKKVDIDLDQLTSIKKLFLNK